MGNLIKLNFFILMSLAFATPSTNGQLTSLLVGLGFGSQGLMKNFEIINLEDKDLKLLPVVPDFPLPTYSVIGALGYDHKPLICGGPTADGQSSTPQCFVLNESGWYNSLNMTEPRSNAAISKSPFENEELILTGGVSDFRAGIDGISNTSETLTQFGWKSLNIPQLPTKLYFHCMVHLNATSLIVIGGAGEFFDNRITYIYNNITGVWTQGPKLKNGRIHHSCGRIHTSADSSEFSIIVVGGSQETYMSSVEILDINSSQWREGAELPFGISRSALVEDGKGGVILVGGEKGNNNFLDTLYHLKDGDSGSQWTLMTKKLGENRSFHVAFLIDEKLL